MKRLGILYFNNSHFPYLQVSIGVASIFSYLSKKGFDVTIIETACQSDMDMVEQCNKEQFDLIGISTTELHVYHALEIAKRIKSSQETKIIMGGAFPTLFPVELLLNPWVDYVCVGDGEYLLERLMNGITNEEEIKGLWFKSDNNIIQNGVSRPFDLNEYILTDYSCFSSKTVVSERLMGNLKYKIAFTWSSRGCVYGCSYCSNANLRNLLSYGMRYRDTKNLLKEVKMLQYIYGIDGYFLSDENFLFNPKHPNAFVNNSRSENISLPFGFLSRPEHINRNNQKLLESLVHTGWKWVSVGIEIGNEEKRRKILNRHNSNEQIVEAFRICRELGVYTNAFIISGFFFEDNDDTERTKELILQCNPDNLESSIIYPLKGTQIYQKYKKLDLLQICENPLSYFADVMVKHPLMNREELVNLRNYWSAMLANNNSKNIDKSIL